MSDEKRWVLSDYDGSGLYEIQALDEHPGRSTFDDGAALELVIQEAAAGDAEAKEALAVHRRDAAGVYAIRVREGFIVEPSEVSE